MTKKDDGVKEMMELKTWNYKYKMTKIKWRRWNDKEKWQIWNDRKNDKYEMTEKMTMIKWQW